MSFRTSSESQFGNDKAKTPAVDINSLPISVILSKAKDPGNAGSTRTPQGILPPPLIANLAVKDHEYFVYIMSSSSGTLYIGMTNSIYRRALQHKSGEIEGFASKYHCNRLVHCESFDDVHRAIGREKQLKGWLRIKKIALIESKNPRWEDLAEKWGAQMLFAAESMRNR